MKSTITYARYDWVTGHTYDDTSRGGITKAQPSEWDIIAGVQHLVLENLKLVGEYRHHSFEDRATTPRRAKLTDDGCTACHDAKTRPLEAKRMTRQQWKDAVDKMEGQGVDVPSGKKLNALLDYLEQTHGPTSPPPSETK